MLPLRSVPALGKRVEQRQPFFVLLPAILLFIVGSGFGRGGGFSGFTAPAAATEISAPLSSSDAPHSPGKVFLALPSFGSQETAPDDARVPAPAPDAKGGSTDASLLNTFRMDWKAAAMLLVGVAILGLPGASPTGGTTLPEGGLLAAVSAKVGGPVGVALLLAGVLLGMWRLLPRLRGASFQLESFLQSDFFKIFDFWKLLDSFGKTKTDDPSMPKMTAEREAALPQADPVWSKMNQELWIAQARVETLEAKVAAAETAVQNVMETAAQTVESLETKLAAVDTAALTFVESLESQLAAAETAARKAQDETVALRAELALASGAAPEDSAPLATPPAAALALASSGGGKEDSVSLASSPPPQGVSASEGGDK